MKATERQLKILILDDDKSVRDEIAEFLTAQGYTLYTAGLPSEALDLAAQQLPDVVILDIKLPEMDGLTVLEKLKLLYPEIEIIMITGHGDMESVIKAMRLGAADYLTKPFRLHEIRIAIEKTAKYIHLSRELSAVQENYLRLSTACFRDAGYPMVGESPAMQEMTSLITKVARSDETSVFIQGESGTGKELVARGIHALSAGKQHPFCSVNASAVTPTLFESEFFGHKKGAFTNAGENRIGWFELADGGTLFLDEISEMPRECQAKLLRALAERKVVRLGDHHEIHVGLRVIAATNQDISLLLSEKRFREDLFYRLNTFMIQVPPLKARKTDLPLLTEHFVLYFAEKLKKSAPQISPALMDQLTAYDFPGNIRELKNMIERAVILCDGKILLPHHISIQDLNPGVDEQPSFPLNPKGATDLEKILQDTETQLILAALEKGQYNKSKAAELLDISRQSLHRRITRLKLTV